MHLRGYQLATWPPGHALDASGSTLQAPRLCLVTLCLVREPRHSIINTLIAAWQADGNLGDPQNAPYDAIHVGAAAASLPEAYLNQLKPGGRIVVPVCPST